MKRIVFLMAIITFTGSSLLNSAEPESKKRKRDETEITQPEKQQKTEQMQPLYLFNDSDKEMQLRMRLPLTKNHESYDDYLSFKTNNQKFSVEGTVKGTVTFFTLPKGHAIEIPYLAEFFDKFGGKTEPDKEGNIENNLFRVRTPTCGNIVIDSSFFSKTLKHYIPCSDFKKEPLTYRELKDLKIPEEKIHPLDLDYVLWVREGQPDRIMSLKNIGDIVLKSNEYPKK